MGCGLPEKQLMGPKDAWSEQEIALCGPGGRAPPGVLHSARSYHHLGGSRTEEGIGWRANYLGNMSCEEQETRRATEQVEEKTLQGAPGADFKVWEACFCVAYGTSCHSCGQRGKGTFPQEQAAPFSLDLKTIGWVVERLQG